MIDVEVTWSALFDQLDADLDAVERAVDDPVQLKGLLRSGVGALPRIPPIALPRTLLPRATQLAERYRRVEARLQRACRELQIELSAAAAPPARFIDERC